MSKTLGEQAGPLANFKTDVHAPESGWGRLRRVLTWLMHFQSASGRAVPAPVQPWIGHRPVSNLGTGSRTISIGTRLWIGVGLVSLVGLIWFSFRLAAIRIYQVDECMEVYVARILSTSVDKAAAGHVTLFQLPLSWIVGGATSSADLLISGRFLMLELYWLNLVLIAVATGERLFSRRGLAALIGAATLAPLWDYGFEIRHDNLLLTGLLLMWCTVRVRPSGLRSYCFLGVLAAAMEFVAFKSFVYTIPLSLAVIFFPPRSIQAKRWKLFLTWMGGALIALVVIRIVFGLMGIWDLYLAGFQFLSTASTGGHQRFWPWKTLFRLFTQTPLLLASVVPAVAVAIVDICRRGKAALSWDGSLPETIFFILALAALLINPAPYPYNLLHLVPYAFILGFRYAVRLWTELPSRSIVLPAAASVVLFAHLVPFGIATSRHLSWTNYRQEQVMRQAERLTDPAKDPVYDAIGMVSTRPIVDNRAFLHSLDVQALIQGPGPQVRDMLATRPAAVFIPNYRTDWLPEADHDFIQQRYVSVSDDFWVLGKVISSGEGRFEIFHAGRYRISTLEGSDLAGTYPEGMKGLTTPESDGKVSGTLDGVPLSGAPVHLAAGAHELVTGGAGPVAIVWVGPQADRIHRIQPRDHLRLFYNWY